MRPPRHPCAAPGMVAHGLDRRCIRASVVYSKAESRRCPGPARRSQSTKPCRSMVLAGPAAHVRGRDRAVVADGVADRAPHAHVPGALDLHPRVAARSHGRDHPVARARRSSSDPSSRPRRRGRELAPPPGRPPSPVAPNTVLSTNLCGSTSWLVIDAMRAPRPPPRRRSAASPPQTQARPGRWSPSMMLKVRRSRAERAAWRYVAESARRSPGPAPTPRTRAAPREHAGRPRAGRRDFSVGKGGVGVASAPRAPRKTDRQAPRGHALDHAPVA